MAAGTMLTMEAGDRQRRRYLTLPRVVAIVVSLSCLFGAVPARKMGLRSMLPGRNPNSRGKQPSPPKASRFTTSASSTPSASSTTPTTSTVPPGSDDSYRESPEIRPGVSGPSKQAKIRLRKRTQAVPLLTRRDILIGSGITALGVLPLAKREETTKGIKDTLTKSSSESAVERGIRALARAEQQAVETVAEIEIDQNDGNEYWVLRDVVKDQSVPRWAGSWFENIKRNLDSSKIRVLKRKVSDSEVAVAGLAAGALVEAARIALLHPLDTIKTRLQAYSRPKPPSEEEQLEMKEEKLKVLSKKIDVVDAQLKPRVRRGGYGSPKQTVRGVKMLRKIALEERLNTTIESNIIDKRVKIPAEVFDSPFDGLFYALVTSAPQGAVYWAVRDVVKRDLLQAAPTAVGGAISTSKSAAAAGLASGASGYFIAKVAALLAAFSAMIGPLAPSLALDYRSSATLFAVTVGEAAYWAVRTPGEILKTRKQTEILEVGSRKNENPFEVLPSILEVFRIYPILALVDLPQLVGRVWVFLILHNSPYTPTAAETDLVFYTLAAMLAAGACTPFDVARTRLLLQRQKDVEDEMDRKATFREAIEAGKRAAETTALAIEAAMKAEAEERETEAIKAAEHLGAEPRMTESNIKQVKEAGNDQTSDPIRSLEAVTVASVVLETGGEVRDADGKKLLGPEVANLVREADREYRLLVEKDESKGLLGNLLKRLDGERVKEVKSAAEEAAQKVLDKRKTSPSQNPRYEGIFDALSKVGRDEGLEGLFAGVGYRMLWNGLVVGFILAIQRTSYEGVRAAIMFKVLDQLNDSSPSFVAKLSTDVAHDGVNAISNEHSPMLTLFGLTAQAINHIASVASISPHT